VWLWADGIQLLVERGHSFAAIKDYTLAQLRFFSESALCNKQNELVLQAINFRAAQYDKDDFEKHIKALSDG
jgi:hypothetical protein